MNVAHSPSFQGRVGIGGWAWGCTEHTSVQRDGGHVGARACGAPGFPGGARRGLPQAIVWWAGFLSCAAAALL